jgi:hypothetical protein
MKRFASWSALLALWLTPFSMTADPAPATPANQAFPALKDTVILIVRHAEKPETGFELSPEGEKRAAAYATYFQNFTVESQVLKPDYLFATADSKNSHRPRLTLEPLHQATGLKIDDRFGNKDVAGLVNEIEARPHGKVILIAWHHGSIPELVHDLGADTGTLFPKGKWPENVFNWVLELSFDHDGKLVPQKTRRIVEHLMPADSAAPAIMDPADK